MDAPLLFHLVRRLRSAGLPISVRQYLEAVRAIELIEDPFEYLKAAKPVHSQGEQPARKRDIRRARARDELIWLCQTLWARTDQERRAVIDIVSCEVGAPPPLIALDLMATPGGIGGQQLVFPDVPEPAPRKPDPPKQEEPGKVDDVGPEDEKVRDKTTVEEEEEIGAEIAPEGDVPIPTLHDRRLPRHHAFAMKEEPIVSPLWLTAVWRRLVRPVKVLDRRTIDAVATARRAARTGHLLEPVFSTRRDNAARLLVMSDVGAAMAPWGAFTTALARSLEGESSRLAAVGLHYFSGAPGEWVFDSPGLTGRQRLSDVLAAHSGGPLLVFGEAGAVRPPRRDFAQRADRFLTTALHTEVRPIVWLNPMPLSRWTSEFADLASRYSQTHTLELSSENLLSAVDLLRGNAA